MKGSYDAQGKIQFTWVKDILKFNYPAFGVQDIFIYNPDIPGIADIDGDGDIDVAAFTLDFLFSRNVFYYRNMSVENGFGRDSLIFVLQHECHGMFSETALDNNTVVLSPGIDSCADNPWWGRPNWSGEPRHVGSTVTLIDWNADGAMDLVLGDVSVNSLNMLTATIVNDTILMIHQDSLYPSYNKPVNVFSYPSAYFVDINNDDKLDMLVSPTETMIGEATTDSVVWFYENISNSDTLWFDFKQNNLFVGEMIELGWGAYPTIVDVDADGLLDLIVGHFAYTDTFQTYSSGLAYYRNVGTATAPAFSLQSRDWGGFSSLGLRNMAPAFGDIDGDGDMDLFIGNNDGTLTYLRNQSGAGNPMGNWGTPSANFSGINVSYESKPQLVDIDRDGDLDLMIGSGNGRIYYYQNTGTTVSATFSSTPTSNTFGFDLNIHQGGAASPHFVDFGSHFELFLCSQYKPIVHLNNIDNNVIGIYDTISLNFENLWAGQYMSLATADLDNDGNLDYVLGNMRGGLTFYNFNAPPFNPVSVENHSIALQATLFPNPARDQLLVRFDAVPQSPVTIQIFDALGRLQKHWNNNQQQLNSLYIGDLGAGIYFVRLADEEGRTETHKLQKY